MYFFLIIEIIFICKNLDKFNIKKMRVIEKKRKEDVENGVGKWKKCRKYKGKVDCDVIGRGRRWDGDKCSDLFWILFDKRKVILKNW